MLEYLRFSYQKGSAVMSQHTVDKILLEKTLQINQHPLYLCSTN